MSSPQVIRHASHSPIRGDLIYTIGSSALDRVLVARSQHGVCAIFFGDRDAALVADLARAFPSLQLVRDDAGLQPLLDEVLRFVAEPATGLAAPLDAHGTELQRAVWAALAEVPPGSTLSYSELARRVGRPTAVRAVASACAANRLAVAIPCHRAVRIDGTLSGYRWGVARKRNLLALESRA